MKHIEVNCYRCGKEIILKYDKRNGILEAKNGSIAKDGFNSVTFLCDDCLVKLANSQ